MRPIPAPRPQRLARSADALVWRFTDPERVAVPGESIDPVDIEVLMAHRPRYHGWSWLKGKTEHGESLVATVVHEVEKGTSQIITLGAPPTTQRYRLGGGQTKEVHYQVDTPVPTGHASERLRAPITRAPYTEINQTAWTSPERAANIPTCRGGRHPLTDIVARAHEGYLITTTLPVLRPGQDLTPHLDEAEGTRATTPSSTSSGGPAAPVEAAAPSKPHPAPTPTMVISATTRRTARVEQGLAKKAETAPEPVDPSPSRFGVRRASDLTDLFSGSGVTRTFVPPAARSRQSLTPWASTDGDSVALVGPLDLTVPGSDAQADDEVRLRRIRAFAAERLHEHASLTVLSVVGAARDAIIEETRVRVSAPITGDETPCPRYGQVLVAYVKHAGDPLTITALKTHGVATKDPAARTRRASEKH